MHTDSVLYLSKLRYPHAGKKIVPFLAALVHYSPMCWLPHSCAMTSRHQQSILSWHVNMARTERTISLKSKLLSHRAYQALMCTAVVDICDQAEKYKVRPREVFGTVSLPMDRR